MGITADGGAVGCGVWVTGKPLDCHLMTVELRMGGRAAKALQKPAVMPWQLMEYMVMGLREARREALSGRGIDWLAHLCSPCSGGRFCQGRRRHHLRARRAGCHHPPGPPGQPGADLPPLLLLLLPLLLLALVLPAASAARCCCPTAAGWWRSVTWAARVSTDCPFLAQLVQHISCLPMSLPCCCRSRT